MDTMDESSVKSLLATTLDASTASLQTQSPLFSVLPPEIRNQIFSYALRPSHNPKKAYTEGSWYYRPSHTSDPFVGTTLLLTCRRVYLEVAILLASQSTLTYWWGRPPPGKPEYGSPIPDIKRLPPEHRAVTAVHVFIQQFQLESDFQDVLVHPEFTPAHLTLTIRYPDWWYWQHPGTPLALDPKLSGQANVRSYRKNDQDYDEGSWGLALRQMKGLQSFTLELECLHSRKQELESMSTRLSTFKFDMADGSKLVFDPTAKRVTGWSGINRFFEVEREDESGPIYPNTPARRSLRFRHRRPRVTVDGQIVQGELGTRNYHGSGYMESNPEPQRLEYYVTELVWKKQETNS